MISTAVCVILAVVTVFAIELSDTQANSKSGIEQQVHERATLAAALISSLFQTVDSEVPQDSKAYGAASVSDQTLDSQAQPNGYAALLGPSGQVLASTAGFTAQARAELSQSAALALVAGGKPYGLGNLSPYGSTGILDLAVPFPTAFGTRILLTGFAPSALGSLFAGELQSIPGAKGARNYLIDGNDVVLASTNPKAHVGQVIPGSGAVKVLQHQAGGAKGSYYSQDGVADSTWRIVLVAPDGPLFANVTGLHQWVPWLIFIAFALVALVALGLGYRVLRSSDLLRAVNTRLEVVNLELIDTNASLERRATELARSNEELDQFASIASHDLQEPLRKVRTFTEQLTVIEADSLSEQGRDYLERTNAAAARMQVLIQDLLKFSRVTTQGRPFEEVDLAEITREVLVDLEAQVQSEGASVLVGTLPTVKADPLQMRQLLQNLISNALKFRRQGVDPQVAIDAQISGGELQLTVRDNGIGFDQRYAVRIFRVFERLNGSGGYPGTGIGLALCRKIVERHGGSIVADSEPGVGSTFRVTMPVNPTPDLPEPSPSPEQDAAGEGSYARV